ncbi:acyltransferase domain-containing protein, partial [Streptomyces coeruleorubidus]|uniref:acyltransferase domain-containing protein n=1 Tax=Streptomyces coeruleorubidus TaxID=116188 RepID=UPI003789B15D
PTLHAEQPTPHLDWTTTPLTLLNQPAPWPDTHPRTAAVSSFGISGTNAHLILQQPPTPTTSTDTETDTSDADASTGDPATGTGTGDSGTGTGLAVPLLLSARSADALRAQAGQLASYLTARPEVDLVDITRVLATGRAHLPYRAAVLPTTREDTHSALTHLATTPDTTSTTDPYLLVNPQPVSEESSSRGKRVFVFGGQGSQWPGMGARLIDSSPVFADQLHACAKALAPHTDWELIPVLRQEPGAPGLDRVDVVQPALFAVMVALARLWQHAGIQPDAVIGHSQGEIAAAHIAGALTLEDAAAVSALRSKALLPLSGTGAMASLALTLDDTRDLLQHWNERLDIAAANAPTHTVVSGDSQAIDELVDHCRRHNIRIRKLPVDYASHSHHITALHTPIHTLLHDIQPGTAQIPFYSTVTGQALDTTTLTADYWYRNLRQTVQFHQTVQTLLDQDHSTFIETSPHPILTPALNDISPTATTLQTLHRDHDDTTQLLTALTHAHNHGHPITWHHPTNTGSVAAGVPTYPFQRRHYWLASSSGGDATGVESGGHPLLGASMQVPGSGGTLFTGRVSLGAHPWLADHVLHGTVVLPGTALVELALHAGTHTGHPALADLVLHQPLVLPEEGSSDLQVLVEDTHTTTPTLKIHSRAAGSTPGTAWTHHATATLTTHNENHTTTRVTGVTDGVWPPAGVTAVDVGGLYEQLTERGYHYGPAFRALTGLWREGSHLYADITLPRPDDETSSASGGPAEGFLIHPALLDAALHPLAVLGGHDQPAQVPFSWQHTTLHATQATSLRIHLSPDDDGHHTLTATDPAGQPVLTTDRLTLRELQPHALHHTHHHGNLHHLHWHPHHTTS